MENISADVRKVETTTKTKKVEAETSAPPPPKKREKKKAAPFPKPSPKVVMATVGAIVIILVVVFGFPWAQQKFSPAPVVEATLTKPLTHLPTPTRTAMPPSANLESISTMPVTPTSTPDPAIQIAFDFIQSNTPLYERTFEFAWDREFYDNSDETKIENEKLIVTSYNTWGQGYITPPIDIFGPDTFAVEFEFRLLESNPDSQCSFQYWGKNGGEDAWINMDFYPNETADLSLPNANDIPSYNFDSSKANTVTLISLGDKFAVFINGQFATYATLDLENSTDYGGHLGNQFFQSINAAVCEFDNYKYWDLTELDVAASKETIATNPAGVSNFPEPVITYISENPPTFEDDFSTTKAGWGNTSEGIAIFGLIKNGLLRIEDGIDPTHDGPLLPDFKVPGVAFPTTGLFDASDFALQFWFQFGDTKSINLQLRSAETINTGYRFTLEPSGHWELVSSDDTIILAEGDQVISADYNKVLVIAIDNNLAIFINDNLIHVNDGVSTSRTANRIIVIGNHAGANCNFDDFKFWNLDGMKISSKEIAPTDMATPPYLDPEISLPKWAREFSEPILYAIKDLEPDFQDDFSGTNSGWSFYSALIENGVLSLPKGGRADHPYFDGKPNFVFQVEAFPPATCCAHVRIGDYSLYLGPSNWGICRPDWPDCSGNSYDSEKNRITLIVNGSEGGFYLNGKPIDDYKNFHPENGLEFYCGDAACEFDNVKFWNLDNVQLP